MTSIQTVAMQVLRDVLALQSDIELEASTPLLGHLPELDSMAVVTILTTLEDEQGFSFDDDELSADIFESVGTFVDFLAAKSSKA